jgi:hypothetical protein
MKRFALLILLCAACMGQDTASSAECPIMVAVASTDVRLQNVPNVVIWFENQSQKTLERARVELFMVDSGGTRHAASARYLLISQTAPGQTGLAVRPSQQEAEHFGESWRGMRGVEVRVTDAVFTDGTRWEPASGTACSRTFLNSQYEPNLRQWHRELRARWNRQHPDEPIPDSALQALLQPERDGWR